MNCEVCGAKIAEGMGECGCCGYPVLVQLGDAPEIRERKAAAAADYREKLCGEIEVGFYAYTHAVVTDDAGNESLKRERADQVPLAVCGDLLPGQTEWCLESFVRPLRDTMDCRIYIRRGSRLIGPELLKLPVPSGKGDIQIGLEKVSDFLVRICVGNETQLSRSEEINILTIGNDAPVS